MTDNKNSTITVAAAQYEDYDDCLAAAEAAAQERYSLQGWSLDPRWVGGDEGNRDEIALTVPAHMVENPEGARGPSHA